MMTKNKKYYQWGFAVIVLMGLIGWTHSSVTSQCCGNRGAASSPRVVQRPVQVVSRPTIVRQVAPVVFQQPTRYVTSRPVPVSYSTYRTIAETVMQEEEVTRYETIWETETRYRTHTVSRQIPETSVRTEIYMVQTPVWETVEKDTSYDVVRYVSETSEREEIETVSRPETKMEQRQYSEIVQRPVQTTVMQERQYTVNRAVTSHQVQYQDRGQFIDQYVAKPNREYTRLTWQEGGDYYDPTTGTTKRRLAGFYWTNLQEPTQYTTQKVYQPNIVAVNVPVTTFIPETVVEKVPVEVTTFQQEQITRTEQVPVTNYVQEQLVKKIPVTTYKPVTERVVQKTPIKVCRMQNEEKIREIPVTTYKTVIEEIREPYTIKVARQVPQTVKVSRPVTIYKQVSTAPTPIATCSTISTEVISTETTLSQSVQPAIPLPLPDTSELFANNQTVVPSEETTSLAPPLTTPLLGKTDVSTPPSEQSVVVAYPSETSPHADEIEPTRNHLPLVAPTQVFKN